MRQFNGYVVIALVTVAVGSSGNGALAKPVVVPQPVEMVEKQGEFTISNQTQVVANSRSANEARKLIDALAPAMGFELKLVDETPDAGVIVLTVDEKWKERLGAEGYMLTVTPRRIDLSAAEPAGLFYGVQTLRQLLPPQIFSTERIAGVAWTVPCVPITDYPRFAWRGLLIDPGATLHSGRGCQTFPRRNGTAQVQPPADAPDRQ